MGGGGVSEGETQPAEGWQPKPWRSRGGIENEEALSEVLYCTLSEIAAQIRASHRNHLHTDQCTVCRDDPPVVDLFIWRQQENRKAAGGQLCLHGCSMSRATSS